MIVLISQSFLLLWRTFEVFLVEVDRKPLIAALGCALLATSLLGCGGSNKLQSITLGIGGTGGFFNLAGIGGTLQLKATGNYSNSKTHDLTNVSTYTVVPDGLDSNGAPLNAPPSTRARARI